MKIEQIEIKEFRCFKDVTVDFHDKLNVIVGANASGKSSFLTALAYSMMLDSDDQMITLDRRFSLPSKPNENGKFIAKINLGQKIFMIYRDEIKYLFDDESNYTIDRDIRLENREDHLSLAASSQTKLPEPILFPSLFPNKSKEFFSHSLMWTKRIQSENYSKFVAVLKTIDLPLYAFYQTNRRFPEKIALSHNALQKQFGLTDVFDDSAFDPSNNHQSLFDWFYVRENQEMREAKNRKDFDFELPELKSMRKAIADIIGNVKRVFFEDTPPRLKVKMEDDSVFNIKELSDGYRNMLLIIMDFARRLGLAYPGYDNPNEAPAILLIDEIELHLHPKWQQRVLPDLQRAFPNTQIFVTTHSPAILSTVKRENIIILDENHQAHKLPPDIGTYGADTQKILTRVFGAEETPSSIETGEKFKQYLRLIDKNEHESAAAIALRNELNEYLGDADPTLLRADSRIIQKKFLKK
ncbi:MAG: AAA family ATPase [Alphaproteobacteria bacterium]|nr:AAA family ATPase [Alphaproteobacteria bacterium]